MTCITIKAALRIHKNGTASWPADVQKAFNACGMAKGWKRYRWPNGKGPRAAINASQMIGIIRVTLDAAFHGMFRCELSADAYLTPRHMPTFVAHYEPKTGFVALFDAKQLYDFIETSRNSKAFRAFEMKTPADKFVDDPRGQLTLAGNVRQIRGIKNLTTGWQVPLTVLEAAGVVLYMSATPLPTRESIPPLAELLAI